MIPEAHVSHRMARRLRIEISSKKGDVSYFSILREQLSALPGVEEITVNPQIGSALIFYTGKTENLFQLAKSNELFQLKKVGRKRRTLFENVADTFRIYNKDLKQMTGGELDIPSLVFMSLLVSGIWQIARGNLGMPAWYTAFYYAVGVFAHSQVDEPDEGGEFVEEFGDVNGE